MSSAGFNRPGVECEHCREPFDFLVVRSDVKRLSELPDPFVAVCPNCGKEATYPHTSVGTLAGVGPR
jgi:hypothetical protein